jgi:hypothetical protein
VVIFVRTARLYFHKYTPIQLLLLSICWFLVSALAQPHEEQTGFSPKANKVPVVEYKVPGALNREKGAWGEEQPITFGSMRVLRYW